MSKDAPNAASAGADEKVELGLAIRQLVSYAKRYTGALVVAALASIAGAVLSLVGPGQLGEMTNIISAGLTAGIDMGAVQSIGVTLAVIYGVSFILSYGQGWIMANVTQALTRDMRRDMSQKIDRLPLEYLDSTPQGDVLSRVSNDVDSIGQNLNQTISNLVSAVVQFGGAAIMMCATNWQMAAAGIVSALLGMALTMRIIAISQPYFTRQQQALGAVDGQVEEVMGGLDVVKVTNGEASESARFHERNELLYDAAWRSSFLSGMMMPLMIFIGNISYVVVCIVGGALAQSGSIPFGTVVAFMIYIRLFTQPMMTIAQAATSVQTMAAASERVFEFLGEQELEDESGKPALLDRAHGDVEFSHVRFGYGDGVDVIHDLSVRVRAGQKIAIVGPTGAGKTTLVNLLMRFYELRGGSIRIDGISTRDTTHANLHDQFAMVLQDTWFFKGTLRENIAFGTAGVTDKMLDEACEACGLMGYVRSLPHGYDTIQDSSSISAGQRQLMTIARAMVKDAPLLILDEATSSVDTRTELKVQRAMDTLVHGRTSFVIAHRLSTIRDADLILYMEGGDVLESGTHEELLARGGGYATLYNSQFEDAA